jgi:hypothetical protein
VPVYPVMDLFYDNLRAMARLSAASWLLWPRLAAAMSSREASNPTQDQHRELAAAETPNTAGRPGKVQDLPSGDEPTETPTNVAAAPAAAAVSDPARTPVLRELSSATGAGPGAAESTLSSSAPAAVRSSERATAGTKTTPPERKSPRRTKRATPSEDSPLLEATQRRAAPRTPSSTATRRRGLVTGANDSVGRDRTPELRGSRSGPGSGPIPRV